MDGAVSWKGKNEKAGSNVFDVVFVVRGIRFCYARTAAGKTTGTRPGAQRAGDQATFSKPNVSPP